MIVRIETPDDFDFVECVDAHGWRALLPFTWHAETATLERIEEFELGAPATIRIRAVDGGVEADVEGIAVAGEVENRVRRMLQLDLPMDGFHRFCAANPVVAHIPERKQGRMLRSPTLFEDVIKVLATTNTTWGQTKGMVARIVENFGTQIPGDPSRKSFPRPDHIACVSLDDFASKAKMGYRNAAAHKIASDVASGSLDLDEFQDPSIPSDDLYKLLLGLAGIGPYAASCLMIYLGRYDRVNVDSWARMMVGKELGKAVTDKEAHAFFEPYGQWKALVYHFYNWKEAEPEY